MNSRIAINLILIGLILFFGIVIMNNIYSSMMGGWALGELLINYEGGFVRRGILGQIVYLTGSPLFYINILQKISVLFFVVSSSLLVLIYKDTTSKLFFTFMIILAPGSLYDLATGGGFAYLDRKEIWFYDAIILLILISIKFNFYSYKAAILTALISFVMILHHELFAVFFAPVIFLMYLLQKRNNSRVMIHHMLIYAILTAIAFSMTSHFHGDIGVVNAIKASYANLNIDTGGGINALAWTFSKSNSYSIRMLNEGSVFYWVFFLSLAFAMSTLFALNAFKKIDHIAIAILISLSMISAALLASYSGWDWGRWISTYSIGIVLMISLLKVVLVNLEDGEMYRFSGNKYFENINLTDLRYWVSAIIVISLMSFLTLTTRVSMGGPQEPKIILDTKAIQKLNFPK